MRINLAVNGRRCTWEVNPSEVLLDVLRDKGYVSVKRGCGEGFCGVCTVLVDGKRYNACLLLVGQVHGRSVKTVEALGTTLNPHPIQQAFVDTGAVQCGFCTPGLVLTVKALLDRHPDPSEKQIRAALDGNLCRCTGYVKVLDAVHRAVELTQSSSVQSSSAQK